MSSVGPIGKERKRFIGRIKRAQELAARRPALYAARVLFFFLLGYAYLLLLAILLIGSVAGFALAVWVLVKEQHRYRGAIYLVYFLVPLLIGVIGSVIGALRMEMPAPAGLILRRKDVPELFALIDDLRRTMKVRRIDRVLLVEDFNASIAVVPRLFGFAGTRYFLCLGLPLMQAFSPDQLRAVIAHEFGHIAGGMNRMNQMLYKHARRWELIYEAAARANHFASFLIRIFVRWYVPRLERMIFTMLRAIELEADRIAARTVGQELFSVMLAALTTRGHYIGKVFWSTVTGKMKDQFQPDDDVYFQLRRTLREGLDPCREAGWLSWELASQPNFRDSHPTLSERLHAIGALDDRAESAMELIAHLSRGEEETAARHLLGESEEEFTRILSLRWKSAIEPYWRDEYSNAGIRQSILRDLENKRARGAELSEEEHWLLCLAKEEFEGHRAAFGCYKEYLELNRESAKANFAFGRILITESDERALPYLKYAMQIDPFFTPKGCDLLCNYYYRQERHEEARPYEDAAARFALDFAEARDERTFLEKDDLFKPHGLSPKIIEEMAQKLASLEEIKTAWIVQKEVEFLPQRPAYVLALRVRNPSRWTTTLRQTLIQYLDVEFDTILLLSGDSRRSTMRRLRRVEDSLILTRK